MGTSRLKRFLYISQFILSALAILAVLALFSTFVPETVFKDGPATGGDTGSHFWPLYVLHQLGFKLGTFRFWSPGNLAGEPIFVHYFPFPFFFMEFLARLGIPLGTAFNVGTLLQIAVLPVSAFWCVRWMGFLFPAPILAMIASCVFVYHEGFSAWGGNFLSTLAGQFAHGYALNFALLGIGRLVHEIRKGKTPFGSVLFFALTALSHAYVYLGLPFVLMGLALFTPAQSRRFAIRQTLIAGGASFLLSAWFIYPMVDNNKWMTPFNVTWGIEGVKNEIGAESLWVLLAFFVLALGLIVWRKFRFKPSSYWIVTAFVPAIVFYLILFFVAKYMGVVDIRALPQVILFVCMLVGIGLAAELRKRFQQIWVNAIVLTLVFASLGWFKTHVYKVPSWMEWNYSGWKTKTLYPPLKEMSDAIRGGFSDPRVIYEHHMGNNGAGTIRVFEMLPYFSGRATLESSYLQASVAAPTAFYLQALVSQGPSCPFWQYKCPPFLSEDPAIKMNIMGANTVIGRSDELNRGLAKLPTWEYRGPHGPWSVWVTRDTPRLVEVIGEKPELVQSQNWKDTKDEFYHWFESYRPGTRWKITPWTTGAQTTTELLAPVEWGWSSTSCDPKLELDFNRFYLQTKCPGKLHVLKIGFHPNWVLNTGDPYFPISPGFLALVPSAREVRGEFNSPLKWHVADGISMVSLLVGLGIYFRRKRRPE